MSGQQQWVIKVELSTKQPTSWFVTKDSSVSGRMFTKMDQKNVQDASQPTEAKSTTVNHDHFVQKKDKMKS